MKNIYVVVIVVLVSSLIAGGCAHNFQESSQNSISFGHLSTSESGNIQEGRKGSEEVKEKKINGTLVVLGVIFTIAGIGLYANADNEENSEEDKGMYKTFGTIGFCAGIPMTLFGLIPR
jgi:hypothetical protein